VRSLTIHRESIESHAASDLLASLNAEIAHRYSEPGPSYSRVIAEEVQPGRGAFVIARSERVPVGCGAIRRVDGGAAELKAIYVLPSFRRLGVGRALIQYLESVARELKVEKIVLETGGRQPEELVLYGHLGFELVPQAMQTTLIRMQKRLSSATS
jgi:GNAT superfamily N-acetyltransferase